MKILISVILMITLCSCGNEVYFDKTYYERISGIKFPAKYKVVETYDNAEFVTAASLKIDSSVLKEFSTLNHFDRVEYPFSLFCSGINALKGTKPGFESKEALLYVSGYSKTNIWLYIIDIKKEMLWVEIMYPDHGGTNPGE